jgi:hypothetical protein
MTHLLRMLILDSGLLADDLQEAGRMGDDRSYVYCATGIVLST